MPPLMSLAVLCLSLLALRTSAQSCPSPIAPSGNIKTSIASGYQAQVVATGLSDPRGLKFDTAGNLLVIEQGSGDLTALSLSDANGCVSVKSSTTVNSGSSVSGSGRRLIIKLTSTS